MSKVGRILCLIAETDHLSLVGGFSPVRAQSVSPNEPQLCWANTEDSLVRGRLWLSVTVISRCQSRQWMPLCPVYRFQSEMQWHVRRPESFYCTQTGWRFPRGKSYEANIGLHSKRLERNPEQYVRHIKYPYNTKWHMVWFHVLTFEPFITKSRQRHHLFKREKTLSLILWTVTGVLEEQRMLSSLLYTMIWTFSDFSLLTVCV